MHYPQHFILSSKSNEQHYSSQGPGDFSVSRLVAGQSRYWKSSKLLATEEKKILFLSDWTSLVWSQERHLEVQAILRYLINESFIIYVWQHDKLERLTLKTIQWLPPMPWVAPDVWEERASTLSIPKHKLLILDDYWLSALIDPSVLSRPRSIKASIVMDYWCSCLSSRGTTASDTQDVLQKLLLKNEPKIEIIIQDEFFICSLLMMRGVIENKKLRLQRNYKKIVFLEEEPFFKDKLSWGEDSIFFKDLKNIEDFASFVASESPSLNLFLNNLPNLKKLYLTGNTTPLDFFSNNYAFLPTLRDLTLKKMSFSQENLFQLLNKTPLISSLSLVGSAITPGPLLKEENSLDLKNLRVLNLANSAMISPETISILLRAVQNSLEEIGLAKEQLFILSLVEHFKKLNKLTLHLLTLSLQELVTATHYSSFKILYLMGGSIEGTLSSNEIAQSNLLIENLCLNHVDINTKQLILLIEAMPFLKYLIIDRCEDVDKNDSILKNLLFSRKIHLGFVSFTKSAGETLFGTPAAKHAKSLLSPSQNNVEDPIHNAATQLTFTPTKKDFKFNYRPKNTNKDQAKLIEQLSQYVTLRHHKIHFINKIQDGICGALSQLFLKKAVNEWENLVEEIVNWSGEKETLNEQLEAYFTLILEQYKAVYIKKNNANYSYLGLANTLDFLEKNSEVILVNPWHTIALKKASEGQWMIYDPNFIDGYKSVPTDKVKPILQKSLGLLILVKNIDFKEKKFKENPEEFIRTGGLLALCECTSLQQQSAFLAKLSAKKIPKAALKQGLLLRTTSGAPAWKLGLNHPRVEMKNYTHALLQQFKLTHPQDFLSILTESISHLEISKQTFYAQTLFASSSKIEKEIGGAILQRLHTKKFTPAYFAPHFETWHKEAALIESKKKYCQRLVNGSQKKRLIEFSSTEQVRAMSLALQLHCRSKQRPVFYIHSADDVVCASPYIKKEGQEGILKPGPGGALHRFLTTPYEKANPPFLIINYDGFTPDDFVRLNSLLDNKPMADGTNLPKNACIIGLINPNKANCYQGGDFYSRFGPNAVETCSLSAEELVKPLEQIVECSDRQDLFPINLYKQQNWEERLLGTWVLQKDKLMFKEGLLAGALASGLTIEIQNGLWENDAFCNFWERARTLERIDYEGEFFDLRNKVFARKEGYDWQTLMKNGHWLLGLKATELTLNPTEFNRFFNRYHHDDKSLIQQEGFIEAHHGKDLNLNLTRALTEDEWAALLAKAQEHHVKLHCHCAPNVSLPSFFEIKEPLSLLEPIKQKAGSIICSSDIDVTVAQLTQDGDWQIMEISECNSQDLLYYLSAEVKQEGEKVWFEFNQSERALLVALAANRKVVLKGTVSPELADVLAPLLLKEPSVNAAPLVIVTSNAHHLNYLTVEEKEVSPEEKRLFLEREMNTVVKLDLKLIHESASQLRARLQTVDDPWRGLYGLSGNIKLAPFEAEESEEKSQAFLEHRRTLVNECLAKVPYVFLAGISGVGKSTFVEKELLKVGERLYYGKEAMGAWAQDRGPYRKILFLDEANINATDWSQFEDLFNNPPSMLIDGVYYPLDSSYKVVFAGNPLNYGGERRCASLFKNHGNVVIFDPMPQEFIYQAILKPIFLNTAFENHTLSISSQILKIYHFLCECSESELLISPRELEMIALLILANVNDLSPENVIERTNYYGRQIVRALVPDNKLHEFDALFPPAPPIASLVNLEKDSNFLLLPSRQGLWQQLQEWTNLSDYRREHQAHLKASQLYGGLGGFIIEGEPGIGKSELVLQFLQQQGYQRIDLHSAAIPEKAYYYLPASMAADEKKELLIKAVEEGVKVLCDEINSIPLDEPLLNNILMGKKPDGQRAAKSGFMIIGTQNPQTMGGRYTLSKALERRFTKVVLPPYSTTELEALLIGRGVEAEIATPMVVAYEQKAAQAKQEQLTPAPTVRDLLSLSDSSRLSNSSSSSPSEPVLSSSVGLSPREIKLDSNYYFTLKWLGVCCLGLGLLVLIATLVLLSPPATMAMVGAGMALSTTHTITTAAGLAGGALICTGGPLLTLGFLSSSKERSNSSEPASASFKLK